MILEVGNSKYLISSHKGLIGNRKIKKNLKVRHRMKKFKFRAPLSRAKKHNTKKKKVSKKKICPKGV